MQNSFLSSSSLGQRLRRGPRIWCSGLLSALGLVLLLVQASPVLAQAPAWAAAVAGSSTQLNGTTRMQATAVDASGNVFVTGSFTGQVAFGPTILKSVGAEDLFVAKYVPGTSTWAWAQSGGGTFGDYGYGIAVSGTSVYVTGSINNNTANSNGVLFGGTGAVPGTVQQNGTAAANSDDLLVAKYTDNGATATLGWTQVGGGTSGDIGYGIAVSGTSVYVTGGINNNTANSNGVLFGGTGTTAGTVVQNGATTNPVTDVVVAKYTDNGATATLGWTQVGGGTFADYGTGIAVSGTNVYVTGVLTNSSTNSNGVLFGGTGTTAGTVVQKGVHFNSTLDMVVAKYTDNGATATLGWTQVGGGTDDDLGQGIAVSGTSVYVTGYIVNNTTNSKSVLFGGTGTTAGTVVQNGASATSSSDLVVAKYTDNGATATLGWTQVGGGTGTDQGLGIAVSGTSVYVTGALTNTTTNSNGVLFGGTGTTAGTVVQNGVATAGLDAVVAKYTDNGATATLGWTQVGGGTDIDRGQGIAVRGTSVYVAGNISSGHPFTFGAASTTPLAGTGGARIFLGQLTDAGSNGTWQTLAATANGGTSQTRATAVDASGNVFVTGTFTGQVTFGNTVLSSLGANDMFVAKYVPGTSTWAWAQSGGGISVDQGNGIAVSGTSVYVTGYIYNNTANSNGVLFGGTGTVPGTVPQNGTASANSYDVVVAKYTDNGTTATLRWTQVGGGTSTDQGLGIAVSGTSVYVTGILTNNTSNSTGVLFGGTGTTAGTVPQYGATATSSGDVLVAKYTDNGSTATLGWTQSGGGIGSDQGNGIAVSGTSVYVTGYVNNDTANNNAALFGGTGTTAGASPQYGASATSSNDVIVAKYTDNGATATLGWTQVGGGTGSDQGLGIAASGTNVYVTGILANNTSNSTGVLFGGTGITAGTAPQYGATATSSSDILVAKYTDNGSTATLGWTQVGGGTSSDQGYGIAVNGAKVYVTGLLINSATNSNGVLFGGAGTVAGTMLQNGATANSFGGMLVAKYTDNGATATLGWTQVGGSAGFGLGNGIAVSGTSVYAAGYVSPVAIFGSTSITSPIGNGIYVNVLAQLVDVPPLPILTSLSPTSGLVGTSVTLTGTNFTGATGISFNGTAAVTFSVTNATTATVTVPAGTTTGNVTITTPNGTSNGLTFTVTPPLAITGTSPLTNARAASASGTTTITFNQAVTAGSAAALKVFSAQRGGLRSNGSGTTTVSGSTVSFAPTYAFQPGETVQATVTTAATATAGGSLAVARVLQFTTAAGVGPGLFSSGTNPAVGANPYGVAVGDVDGDGDLDMLTANLGNNTVGVRFNNGSGVFSGGTNPAVGNTPISVAVGDVDGDGDLDLLTANYNPSGTVSVRLNNGSGVFSGGSDPAVGSNPVSVAVGDVDGDGDLDMLCANTSSNTVSVRLNNGSGVFSAGTEVSVSNTPYSVAVGDVDGDGDLDMLVANFGNVTVSVRLNNGSGVFSGTQNVAVGSQPSSVAVGDVDGDGDLDFVVANEFNNTVGIRFNDGSGVFSGSTTTSVGATPYDVVLGDVDGDGDLDMVTSNNTGNSISVRLNNGSGVFSGSQNVAVGSFPYSIALGDVDGDGDLDVLAANSGGTTVSVRLNQPAPTLTSLSPASGPVGTSVILTGTVFTGATAVSFNGTSASGFVVNSSTSITATVPSGTTTGNVTVTTPGGTTNGVTFTVTSAQLAVLQGSTSYPSGGAAYGFGSQVMNTSGTAVTFTLSNAGTAPLTISSITTTSDYATSGTLPTSVAAGSTAPVSVVFTPTATGTRPGTLVIVSTLGTYTVNLTGTGAFAVPTLTSLSPTSGPVGTSVTLTGTNFTGATGISFNGTAAVTFSVTNATTATATVPAGTTTGNVTLTTPGGTTNGLSFTLITDLTVSSPAGIPTGTYRNITVTGTGTGTLGGDVTVTGALLVQPGGSFSDGCHRLLGSGSFTLAAGATLAICDPAGLGATGAVQVTGGRSFHTDASYLYNGTLAQVTGSDLPAQVRNLTVNNAQGLTLTQPVAVAQLARLQSGNLTTSGQAFTLLSSASGTAVLDNTGGVVSGTGTMQRAITGPVTGPAYRHFSSPVGSTTVADLGTTGFTPVVNNAFNSSATPAALSPFPTIQGYDQARLATAVNNLSAFDKGWFSPAALTDVLVPTRGYTVNAPVTAVPIDFVGTFNNAAQNSGALNRGPDAQAGWQLLGNPYPAPLDWSSVTALQRPGIDAALYVFQASAQYAGSYRTFLPGVSDPMVVSPLVAAGAGYFVRVSTAGTPGAVNLTNANRATTFDAQPAFGRAGSTRPALRLVLAGTAGTDDLTVYAEAQATAGVDAAYDATKLTNPSGLNLATVLATGEALAIDGRPAFGPAALRLPLRVGVPATGRYTLTAALLNLPAGLAVILTDALTGQQTDLRQVPAYAFTAVASAPATGRFWLNLTPAAGALATAPALTAAEVSLFPNPAQGRVTVLVPAVAGATQVAATLLNALGQAVQTHTAALPAGGAALTLDVAGLARGVYVLRLNAGATTLVKRLVVD